MAVTYPAVMVSSTKKLIKPRIIDLTGQTGFHDSGWKLDMLKHIAPLTINLPVSYSILISGGFHGYSGGNMSLPK